MLQTVAVIEFVPQWLFRTFVERATKSLFYLNSQERNKCNEVHLMTFGAQEVTKKASCDKQRKSIKYSIYDSSFWKSNYGYEHNSIWIDTEQNDFLLSLPTQEVVWLRRYNNIFYISKVWYFAYSIYVQRTNTHNLLNNIVHNTVLRKTFLLLYPLNGHILII